MTANTIDTTVPPEDLTPHLHEAKRTPEPYGRGEVVTLGIADGLPYGGRDGYGGASTVTSSDRGGWNVSYATNYRDGAELHIFRVHHDEPNEWGGLGTIEHHPEHYGLMFATSDEANEFAYNHGYLKYFFYRKNEES